MTDTLLHDLKAALGDAYHIERELTGGGMSRVFVAMEHALGREVVIKVLPPELAAGVNRERFRREVQMAARLSHPYIVPLLHAGESGELLWFTMPFIQGESLRHRLEEQGPLSVRDTVQVLRDVVEALAYAHTRGVVHRDIKPANILSDGQHGVVTDFGVAKALYAALPSGIAGHTTSGMAIGTPAYMAPEQLAADPSADHRVDIYAVGLLAYELLIGVSPFREPSPTATMTAQLTRTPESLHTLRAEVPPQLSALISRCLSKNPADRPADAHAVLVELDRISGVMAADAHRLTTTEMSTVVAPPKRIGLTIAAVATLILVFGGIYWAQLSGRTAAPPPARVDTLIVAGGTDVGGGELLNAPLTRADSLKIAEALMGELQRTPSVSAREQVAETTLVRLSLDAQIAMADSIIRARMTEFARARGGAGIPTAPPQPGVVVSGTAPTAATTPRKMVVVTAPRPGLSGELLAINAEATKELARRVSGGPDWQIVVLDKMPDGGTRDSTLAGAGGMVFVSMVPGANDSVDLRITVRNLGAGSAFGFNVTSSEDIFKPTSLAPFLETIDKAARVVRDLKRVPVGGTWSLDQRSTTPRDSGSGRRGGPGGGREGGFPPPEGRRFDRP